MTHSEDRDLTGLFCEPHVAARLEKRVADWSRRGDAFPFEPCPPPSAGKLRRRARRRRQRSEISPRSVSGVVAKIATEMMCLTADEPQRGRNRRFIMSHVQQIAMYVCHVVLQMTMTEVGRGFGRDRSTVGHACARVEDRRDEAGFDRLVTAIETVTSGVFTPIGRKG
ncbi:helix-turn-helix domain-containing protein [Rhizobium sp. FKL33]|uniref:helix-turn-helix domain-containing protein n=1 Tax=Rhizobium sp. FKL33 TaxID=2562307 RepID=UPI001FED7894|nr:helix-turn-helix domain-containing protein [Rhizobium sp. FKL33]